MTDFYSRKFNGLSQYNCDQTIIIKREYLKQISRVQYEDEIEIPEPPSELIEWYPCTNSYYSYTEDVDVFARVSHLMGSGSVESLMSLCECECTSQFDAYSEKLAQTKYLMTVPTCFLILGKPGIGEEELGRLLADHWHCVYIDPETLINEEISSGSRAGRCIEFNLRCGRAIGIDIILRLVEKRVNTRSAQHRGFVICGFPLIPNDLYEDEPVSAESTIFTVQEIFDEVFESTIELGKPPEAKPTDVEAPGEGEEPPETAEEDVSEAPPPSEKSSKLPSQKGSPLDLGSTTSTICGPGDLENIFEEQINLIFSLFPTSFIIIYMVCSNSDVVFKRRDYRFDCTSLQLVDLQREHCDKMVYTYFSRVPGVTTDEMPEDYIDVVKHNTVIFNDTLARKLVKLPANFQANVVTVLNRYRYSALPVIEKRVLLHDAQHLIRVDGRISPVRMLSAVKTKLHVLPLQRVALPEKLVVAEELPGEGEPPEETDFEGMSFEECFQMLRRKQTASPMFKWEMSDWGVKCPVSMKEGGYLDGQPKLAVHFMNKMFFLSSEEAFIKFRRNPREYLLPPYPKSSCKIFIMGPQYSGKTAVATCLGYLLKGEVLDFDTLVKDCLKARQNEYEEQIRTAALNHAMDILNKQRKAEWEQQEEEKREEVGKWLKEYQQLLREIIVVQAQRAEVVLDISSFPTKLALHKPEVILEKLDGEETVEEPIVTHTFEELETIIEERQLPGFDDIVSCKRLLVDPSELIERYLPVLLQPDFSGPKPASVDDDFVKQYADAAINNASYEGVELTSTHVAELIKDTIKGVEERSQEQGYNGGGWILDGMTPHDEVFNLLSPDCIPDDIFVLKDTPDHQFLLDRFQTKGANHFKNYRQFFLDIGETDVAWRTPSVDSTTSAYKANLANQVIGDVLDEVYVYSSEHTADEPEEGYRYPRTTVVDAYTNDLNKFDEEWEQVRRIVSTDKNITVTEISVTNKSFNVMLKEIVKNVKDRYRQLGSEFTSEERVQELEDFGEPEVQGEELEEAEEKEDNAESMFFQNRRFGDSFLYCPVTFHNHWVLWKGKEEHAAKFKDKLYLMCNEEAKNAFIKDPRAYLLQTRPPNMFPPPRICIIGPRGCGKTTAAQSISRNLGLYSANYDNMLKYAIAPKSTFNLLEVLKTGVAGTRADKIQSYFGSDRPLPEDFLKPLILPCWFEDPKKTFGFVIDGFPRRPSDVDFMVKHSTIPDIVLELTMSQGEINNRLIPKFEEDWKKAESAKQEMLQKKQDEILSAWKDRRDSRFKELLDQRREERYASKMKEKENVAEVDEEMDRSARRAKSEVSYDSVAEEADIEEINKIMEEEMPLPLFEEPPDESLEEAVEKFSNELEDSYTAELSFLGMIQEQCRNELITYISIDAGMSEEKVFTQIMNVVKEHKFRNKSFFERVYSISVEMADRLLSIGYFFLSKFGKTCPVQVYEKKNPVQMYLPSEQKYQLYPVIHRQYIYFLAEKENFEKFKENPLKYISIIKVDFPLLPLRLAIVGPPKSGKSTLAERFGRDLGMRVITIGQAGRYVNKHLPFSELAVNMEVVLRRGWELTSEMAMKSVQALTYDGKSITQGFVFDGFPNCKEEICHLAALGLVPNFIIDLEAESADIYNFLAHSKGKWNRPVFCRGFIDHRYKEWLKMEKNFRDWLDKEYQIMRKIKIKPCKWGVWNASFELAAAIFTEIKHYHIYARCDNALKLENMLITPLEFVERESSYKHYCPCCLHYNHALISGGNPPDRTGVVQFRNFFYYICPDHLEEFISTPESFLSPYNNHPMPKDLPLQVSLTSMPDNCYQEGVCILCFWDNQPRRVIKQGLLQYAVLYSEKIYLFDTEECMNTFMRIPHCYCTKVINFKEPPLPPINYRDLPALGLLQQYDVRKLIKAIHNTEMLRPIIPGLSIAQSAALNIGLILKLNNPNLPEKFVTLYKSAEQKYHERRINLIRYLENMKGMINPYLYYDEPLPHFVDPLFAPSSSESESETLEEENSDEFTYQSPADESESSLDPDESFTLPDESGKDDTVTAADEPGKDDTTTLPDEPGKEDTTEHVESKHFVF